MHLADHPRTQNRHLFSHHAAQTMRGQPVEALGCRSTSSGPTTVALLPRKFPTKRSFSTTRAAAAARISDRCGVPEHRADHSHRALLTRQNDRVTAARILVVEDSNAIRLPVVTALSAHGFALASAADGNDLEKLLPSFAPDLVILDVMLPGRDGFELLQVVRRTSTAAVLMLTARDSLTDRLHGLTGGADDYLIKPFAMAELLARIQAVLRRSRPGGSSISIGDLVINDDATLVQREGDSLDLTDTERRLLGYLAAHRDKVVSKTQILTAVWGYDGFDENVVEVHVSSLRRKLEAGGRSRLVHTVRGRGYLLGMTA
jgi:DNA-binding response OmpR family regulator